MTATPLRIDPSRDILDQLVDQVLVFATETQELFAERYGDYDWRADFAAEEPVFWFEREPNPALFRPHFVGSSSGISDTWLWGWENINEFPDEVVALPTKLRDLTAPFEAEELSSAQLPLDADARGEAGLPERTAYSYVYAAMAVSEIDVPAIYRGPTGGGSYAWLVVENSEEFALPAPTPLETVAAITKALSLGLVQDHRLALRGYADRRSGVSLAEEDGKFILKTAAGDVVVTLDEEDRIAHMSSRLQEAPEDTPPVEPAHEPRGFFRKLFGR